MMRDSTLPRSTTSCTKKPQPKRDTILTWYALYPVLRPVASGSAANQAPSLAPELHTPATFSLSLSLSCPAAQRSTAVTSRLNLRLHFLLSGIQQQTPQQLPQTAQLQIFTKSTEEVLKKIDAKIVDPTNEVCSPHTHMPTHFSV